MPAAKQTVEQAPAETAVEAVEEVKTEAVEAVVEDARTPAQRQLEELLAAGVPAARINLVTDSTGRLIRAEKA